MAQVTRKQNVANSPIGSYPVGVFTTATDAELQAVVLTDSTGSEITTFPVSGTVTVDTSELATGSNQELEITELESVNENLNSILEVLSPDERELGIMAAPEANQILNERLPELGQKEIALSTPVTIASNQSPIRDVESSSILTSANQFHRRLDVSGYGTFGFIIKGTWVGTVIFEGSYDGITFNTLTVSPITVGAVATQSTTNGSWYVDIGALKAVQLRCSAYTSGIINITSRLSIASRIVSIPIIQSVSSVSTVSTITTVCCIAAAVSLTATSTEDTATANAGAVFPIGVRRTDTPVANDNVDVDGDLTWLKTNNRGAAWSQPYFVTRSETFTVAANGTTQDVSLCSMKYFSLQVKANGGTLTSWTIVLEVSLNNANFFTVITHTNTVQADGDVVTLANTYPSGFPCTYWRLRCSAIVLGTATNALCYAVGHV